MTETAKVIEQEPPEEKEPKELTPRAVLHYHMQEAHERSIEVKELLLKKLKQDKVASPVEILRIVQKYGDSVERAIETASKLAPYYHPKLEAIEVKTEVEHRFVIRAPKQIDSVDEWMQKTGSTKLEIENCSPQSQPQPQPQTYRPTRIDAEPREEDSIEDERQTIEALNKDADAVGILNIALTKTKTTN